MFFLRFSSCFLLLLPFIPVGLNASTISGTVKDPSGAVIPSARIELRGGDLAQPLVIGSDGVGHFASSELRLGTYSVRVIAEGFEPLEKTVQLGSSPVTMDFQLSLAVAREEITVSARAAKFVNSDPIYQGLRNVGLGNSFQIERLTIKCDVATFLLKSGTVTFLAPVNGITTGAIFIGDGHLNLKPPTEIGRDELNRRIKTSEMDEDFTEIVFRYAGAPGRALAGAMKSETGGAGNAATVLQHWRERVRKRREIPQGFTESLLHGDAMI